MTQVEAGLRRWRGHGWEDPAVRVARELLELAVLAAARLQPCPAT